MKCSLIVAVTENNVIGNDNKMLWHLPDDLKFFKKSTKGHTVIMGRKSFESIIQIFGKPLPDRTNIVVTRNKGFEADGCIVLHSLSAALNIAKEKEDIEPFIIGGSEIYKEAMPLVSRIYLTRIHCNLLGDAYFPDIEMEEWEIIWKEKHTKDSRHQFDFTFYIMEKK